MKKIHILILSMSAFFLNACDNYLDVNPKNSIGAEAFFVSENDLKLYSNSFINDFLDHTDFVFADQYTDMMSTKSSTAFLRGGWTANNQGGWSWGNLRSINYMLDNMGKCQGKVSAAVYNHYEGVARYWRANFYYNKMKTFGGVPWYDHVLQNTDMEQLYKGRDSRQTVARKIYEDLTFASENCLTTSEHISS